MRDSERFELISPDGHLTLLVSTGTAPGGESGRFCTYSLLHDGAELIRASRIGVRLAGAPGLTAGLEVENAIRNSGHDSWTPIAGEYESCSLAYEELTLALREAIDPGRSLWVTLRLYDGAFALRYELDGQRDGTERITVGGDATEFRFPAGAVGYECLWWEDEYRPKPLHEFCGTPGSAAWPPVTVTLPDGHCLVVTEANARTQPPIRFKPIRRVQDALVSTYAAPHAVEPHEQPYRTPWRLVIVATEPAGLIGRSHHLEALCDAPARSLGDWNWVRPGTVFRDMTISTTGARACIDFAAETGMQYVLFDAGWYGVESDELADPTRVNLDLERLRAHKPDHDGFDLPAAIAYARERGIGVFLYVNHLALERRLDRALPVWRDWGVAGIKFGFVEVGAAEWTRWLTRAVEKCASYGLLVNVHDAYRPSGLSRTYPNLMTQEGVRGNEHSPTARHNVTLPFTRYVSGAADYTPCLAHDRALPTDAHQLALGVVFYSPLQHLYWYSRPHEARDVPGRELWSSLPTSWDETRGIAGEIGEYVVVARRRGDRWYLAALTNEHPRSIDVPLRFLAEGGYDVTLVSDPADGTGPGASVHRSSLGPEDRTLRFELPANGGSAAILDPRER